MLSRLLLSIVDEGEVSPGWSTRLKTADSMVMWLSVRMVRSS